MQRRKATDGVNYAGMDPLPEDGRLLMGLREEVLRTTAGSSGDAPFDVMGGADDEDEGETGEDEGEQEDDEEQEDEDQVQILEPHAEEPVPDATCAEYCAWANRAMDDSSARLPGGLQEILESVGRYVDRVPCTAYTCVILSVGSLFLPTFQTCTVGMCVNLP